MTWRVVIVPDAIANGIAVQIASPAGGQVQVLRFDQSAELVDVGTDPGRPSVRLDDDLGRALLDALADHYGSTSGGRQQRADFEHERDRVDRLIGVLDRTLTAAQQRL